MSAPQLLWLPICCGFGWVFEFVDAGGLWLLVLGLWMGICWWCLWVCGFCWCHCFAYCRHRILFALDLGARPQKFQKYYLFSMGPRKRLYWHCATHLGIGALEMPFQVKLTKMPIVNLGLTKSQCCVKIIPKKHFSCFYIKPELLDDFRQRWPSLIQGWLSRTPETLILIWPSE